MVDWTSPNRQARATKRATAPLVWRTTGLRLRFAWHHKWLICVALAATPKAPIA